MKNLISASIALILIITLSAQSPDAFKYQAVARDSKGEVIANQKVSFRISIIQGTDTGEAVYFETHSDSTNSFGLVNLEIGQGETKDDFSTIDWAKGPYFIQIEMDANGGSDYQLMGTSQLLSVPYAKYADIAGSVPGFNEAGIESLNPVAGMIVFNTETNKLQFYDGAVWNDIQSLQNIPKPIPKEKGTVLFFTNAQEISNCPKILYGVEVYIDDSFAGKIKDSYLPLGSVPSCGSEDTFSILKLNMEVGTYYYTSDFYCIDRLLSGTFEVVKDGCTRVFLEAEDSNLFCGQEYYYNGSEKVYMNRIKKKIMVGFIDSLSFNEMKEITDVYPFIEPLTEGWVHIVNKEAIVELVSNLTCEQIENYILEIRENPDVAYCNSFFVQSQNPISLKGLTGRFLVHLNDSTQITELKQLAEETKTKIIRKAGYNNLRYTLYADKNSNGNSLEIANYFYENGEFLYAQPNFILLSPILK
ncbi:hypothetical protein ACFLSA_02605 [Bacteroidota bacterium]